MLVADDEDDIRALVGLAVRKAGCTVVGSVADGAVALDLARAERPELAVLDVSMPGATGLEVCAALRGRPGDGRHPHPAALGRRLPRGRRRAGWPRAPTPTWPSRSRSPDWCTRCARSRRGSRHDHRSRPAPRSWAARAAEGRRLRRLPVGTVLAAHCRRRRCSPSAAVLLGTGTLPVADGELVLAGLAAAFLGTLVARLVTRPAAADDVAVVVPAAPRATGLLWAGTASPACSSWRWRPCSR